MNIFHQLSKFRKKDLKKNHENSEEMIQSFEKLLMSETEKIIPPASCWVLNGESKVTSGIFKGETKNKSSSQVAPPKICQAKKNGCCWIQIR